MKKLVTRDSMQAMLDSDNPAFVDAVIGKALVGIFKRQTDAEQNANDTNEANNVGFTGTDGRSGSLTAKYYLKHKTFLDWQRGMWLKKGKSGFARIAKYHRQLNEIAIEKAERS